MLTGQLDSMTFAPATITPMNYLHVKPNRKPNPYPNPHIILTLKPYQTLAFNSLEEIKIRAIVAGANVVSPTKYKLTH